MNRGDSIQKPGCYKTRSLIGGVALALALLMGTPLSAEANRALVNRTCRADQKVRGNLRETHCKGAKDTYRAKQANTASSMVWTGVTAVCTTACVNRLAAATCTYASIGGTAATSAVQKNFTNGLQSVAGTATGKAAPAAADAAQSSGGVETEACVSAASSAYSSFTQFKSARDHRGRLEEIASNALKMDEKAQKQRTVFSTRDGDARGVVADAIVITNAPECEEGNLKNAAAVLSCAAKMDPELPREIASEQFIKDFERMTGKSADAFFANFKDPATSLMSATSGVLSSQQRQTLAHSVRDMAKVAMKSNDSGAIARVQGGRKNQSGGGEEFDVAGVLSQVLGQLNEGESPAPPALGVESAAFGGDRAPALEAGPDDRAVSIFDRVKSRYSQVSRKFHLGEKQ